MAFSTSYFSDNTYSNVLASVSSAPEQTDTCYYNFDDGNQKTDTSIAVAELPDVVFQPGFRQQLDEQFVVSYVHVYIERLSQLYQFNLRFINSDVAVIQKEVRVFHCN